ncbi:unnamed protein product [Paramecium sonneborni]|uniref:Uncharacterized protein n=1 Tax=Paramecium sonneborni TaxID=65129 RepID=A0A8S1LW22_9CILI|nr:unnamed protein product [Paramecium sonneborni]
MEITLTATIFSFFGWNVYLLIKKYRERMRQNYLQNLIDQESDYLIMNVAPYKKIKVNEEKQTIIKKTTSEELESSSDDFELMQYRRRKTVLEEVKQEKFQEQTYIENTKSFDMLTLPRRKDRKNHKTNRDFSFTSQNQELKEVKRYRKNSKIIMDDSLLIESPKQTNQKSSNKVSEKKINQFEFSNLKDQFEIQDFRQEFENCNTNLVSQIELKQDNQNVVENQNTSQLFPLQLLKPIEQTNDKLNQQQEEPSNIFGKFITQTKPQQDQQQQEQKQQSPQKSQTQPLQNNIGLFSNELKTVNTSLFPLNNEQPIQLQFNQIQQNQNNICQPVNNKQVNEQQQPQKQEPQKMNLFQSFSQTNVTVPNFNLNNQNQDNINQNSINETKQSSINQANISQSFTFGNNSNIQTNSQIGLFSGLITNLTTPTNPPQDQQSNKQSLFSQPPQQTQSNPVQSQPNTGTSLFGNSIFQFPQQKEQSQQSQAGGLFNFSSNIQTGTGLFSNLKKN